MQVGHGQSVARGQRYSAKNTVVSVSFMCQAPDAKKVSLVGDFNGWDASANPMKKHPDGTWHASLPIHSGHHRYQLQIDDVPHLDPRAAGVVKLENGDKASLLSVS